MHQHGDTKLTKTRPSGEGKHWPMTTMAQIRGDERFQNKFWKILECVHVCRWGFDWRQRGSVWIPHLDRKNSFGKDSFHLGSLLQKSIVTQPFFIVISSAPENYWLLNRGVRKGFPFMEHLLCARHSPAHVTCTSLMVTPNKEPLKRARIGRCSAE